MYDSTYEKEKLEMSYQPLYTITNQILAYVSSISEKIGNISATHNLESKTHYEEITVLDQFIRL